MRDMGYKFNWGFQGGPNQERDIWKKKIHKEDVGIVKLLSEKETFQAEGIKKKGSKAGAWLTYSGKQS